MASSMFYATRLDMDKVEYKKRFLRDMRGHLDKIADDYVCPELGSAEFAFAFVPSEAVYWFLINEGYELLREYVKRGVQVVSPLTLSHKIALIRAGVVARKLSEQAGKIRNDIRELSREFSKVDDEWKVLYQTHLRRLDNKAKEVDIAYGNIRNKFGEIAKLGE